MALNEPIDTTEIPGSPGSSIHWFEDFPGRAATKDAWLAAIRRMPSAHLAFVCPVIVARMVPPRVTTHGATYGPTWRTVWSSEGAVGQTNVSADFIGGLVASNTLNRLVGIPVDKASDAQASCFTLLHELGHSVSHSQSLIPAGATALDLPGVHYPRSPGNVHELAVEAYSRWVLRQTNIVWNAATRAAFQTAHPEVGRNPGESVIPVGEVDRRYEAICRATLLRSPALRMIGPGALGGSR